MNGKKSGFTLIELLVVVAIIAVIGAGVAVTYNRLDERAKTAVEINDIGTLSQTIKHWSFLHNWNLPDKLDSLVDTEGRLYSQMPASGPMTGVGDCNGVNGLYAQSGYTFVAKDAPDAVIEGLIAAGVSRVYLHDATRLPANDSTFTIGRMGADVDTSDTAATLATADNQDALLKAEAVVAVETEGTAHDYTTGPYTVTWEDSEGNTSTETYSEAGDFTTALNSAKELVAAGRTVDKLAFIYPGGGATMMGMAMAMNMTDEIISNVGLRNEEVAPPTEDAEAALENGRKYWLVAFGIGRFASIYEGKGARVDNPVSSKRYNDENVYSRYIVVVKVPVSGYDSMTNQGGSKAQVAAILSPQGLSVASLQDSYRDVEEATNN